MRKVNVSDSINYGRSKKPQNSSLRPFEKDREHFSYNHSSTLDRKKSLCAIGVIASITSLYAVLVLVILYFIIPSQSFMFTGKLPFTEDANYMISIYSFIYLGLCTSALTLGLASVFRKDLKRRYGIIAIAISGFLLSRLLMVSDEVYSTQHVVWQALMQSIN